MRCLHSRKAPSNMRRAFRWLEAKRPLQPRQRSPYDILGLSPTAPMKEVKERYRELARRCHPDSRTGSLRRFQELNAAYSLICVSAQTKKIEDEGDVQETIVTGVPRGKIAAVMWESDFFEWLSTLASLVACVYIGLRKRVFQKRRARHPVKPIFDDSVTGTFTSLQQFAAAKTHGARIATTSLVAPERVDMSLIQQRCPLVVDINTQASVGGYEKEVNNFIQKVHEKVWRHVDAPFAVEVVLRGIAAVESCAPRKHALTFIETRPSQKHPKCAVAIRNHKFFNNIGPVQRITISTDNSLHPDLLESRQRQLLKDELDESLVIDGGAFPSKRSGV